jgi:hypothetical protein
MMQFKQIAIVLLGVVYLALNACAHPAVLTTDSATDPSGAAWSPPSPRTGAIPDMTAASCPAKELQYLVGQPRTVLHTMRFGNEVRIEEPGQMVTMEFKGSRTRIVIGVDGKIGSVICG